MAEELEKTEKKGSGALIQFENVTKTYGAGFAALDNVNLEIHEGEFVSIVGPSGAGKSTLLKLIYAEENPTSGNVFFNGTSIETISRRNLPLHRRNIGTVFQDFKLLPKKTTFENVAYALEVAGVTDQDIEEDVPQILEIVGLLDKQDKFPHELSGGEQQKVVLARALISKPKVIIADEPTGNLDPDSSLDILKLLLAINKVGTTVILASHDKAVVDKAGRRVVVIDKGRIVSDDQKGKYKTFKE